MQKISEITQRINLLQLMVLEQSIIINKFLLKPNFRVYKTSGILPSEHGGYFFKIFFSEESGKMIEFHQNEEREILLIFFDLITSSKEYKMSEEVLNFKDFDEMKLLLFPEKENPNQQ